MRSPPDRRQAARPLLAFNLSGGTCMGLRSSSKPSFRTARTYRRPVEPLEHRRLLSTTLEAVADADVQNLDADASIANANFGGDERLRIRAAAGETFETFL